MENELITQLGIDWKLLLSQAVNFFILLTVLTFFVYKPLMKIVKKRNEKIKEGLDKAEEADIRLKEIDNIGKKKIKEAENTSIGIIKSAEDNARVLEQSLQKKISEKQSQLEKDLQESYKKRQEELKRVVFGDAVELIKKTVIKTVELDPGAIDEQLIKKAISEIKNES